MNAAALATGGTLTTAPKQAGTETVYPLRRVVVPCAHGYVNVPCPACGTIVVYR